MKKAISIIHFSLFLFVVTGIVSCKKEAADTNASGNIPTNGWRIGSTSYTTLLALRNVGQPNSVGAFDAVPTANNLNTVVVLFNNTTGIAAGTFKVVTKPNQSDLLADEIMVSASTGYNQGTGQYNKQYVTVVGETVNATVTISGGKAKIVVPQINIISYPINASSTTSTFSGTIVEQ
ncbi:hypothetical protein IQ13_0771 [Lacibacter cauensis]|uniref:Uncharacterized protein n=1 Tax=Lacibacter cauensis TaxID=510947 RepID=A0A562SX45_9BACT|nr:hypothetical protein [Lacibacter cauensis]TWI85608.1 hypothetical protein IQ13_0771 [Lacibacter cauensis]